MSELTFVIGGRTLTASELAKQAAATPKPRRAIEPKTVKVQDRSQATMSIGFVVTGFSPERLAEAEVDHRAARQAAIDHNRALSGSSPDRKPIPPEWDAQRYLREAKPTRARSRPYDMRDAAETCAALLRQAGWQCVNVTEDIRR